MNDWKAHWSGDPVPRLLASNDAALVDFVRRDLLAGGESPADQLWELSEALS